MRGLYHMSMKCPSNPYLFLLREGRPNPWQNYEVGVSYFPVLQCPFWRPRWSIRVHSSLSSPLPHTHQGAPCFDVAWSPNLWEGKLIWYMISYQCLTVITTTTIFYVLGMTSHQVPYLSSSALQFVFAKHAPRPLWHLCPATPFYPLCVSTLYVGISPGVLSKLLYQNYLGSVFKFKFGGLSLELLCLWR